jgi:hypothetical protein
MKNYSTKMKLVGGIRNMKNEIRKMNGDSSSVTLSSHGAQTSIVSIKVKFVLKNDANQSGTSNVTIYFFTKTPRRKEIFVDILQTATLMIIFFICAIILFDCMFLIGKYKIF